MRSSFTPLAPHRPPIDLDLVPSSLADTLTPMIERFGVFGNGGAVRRSRLDRGGLMANAQWRNCKRTRSSLLSISA
jgi:hypothetical protein